jgi:hypothetical protein
MHLKYGRTDKAYVFGLQDGFFRDVYSLHGSGNFNYGSELLPTGCFELSDKILRCIDEGTPGGIHAAGSLILLSNKNAAAFVDKAVPSRMTSHMHCGAAGMAYNSLQYALRELFSGSDSYGKTYSTALSRFFGLKIKHLKRLARPEDTHIARMAVYDGTGRFDNSKLEIMPQLAGVNGGLLPTFVISRRYHADPQDAVNEAGIAAKIALGDDHGFGKLITKEKPFVVMVIGDGGNEKFSSEALMKEVEGLQYIHEGRVIVNGFDVDLSSLKVV